MRALGATDYVELPALAKPLTTPPIGLRNAITTGDRLMHAEAARRGFILQHPAHLTYDRGTGLYRYRALEP